MPIQFKCDQCGQRLSIGTRMAGRRVHCTRCQQSLMVPDLRRPGETTSATEAATPPSPPPAAAPPPAASSPVAAPPPVDDPPSKPPSVPDWFLTPPPPADAPPPQASGGDNGGVAEPARPSPAAADAEEDSDPVPVHRFPRRDSLHAVADRLAALDLSSSSSRSAAAAPQIVVIPEKDESAEWVYEDDDDEAELPADAHLLAVPRRAVYAAVLLSFPLAVGSFVLGMLFAGGQPPADPVGQGPRPCEVYGEVLYARGADPPAADAGGVVILLPRDERPSRDQRIAAAKLGAMQPPPPANDQAIQAIRAMGGDYARIDSRGGYRLRVPDRGRYYLLVLSANRRLGDQEEISRSDLSEIGGYFEESLLLLGDQQYRWRVLRVEDDRKVDVVF